MQGSQGQMGPPGPPGTAGSSVSLYQSLFNMERISLPIIIIPMQGYVKHCPVLSYIWNI